MIVLVSCSKRDLNRNSNDIYSNVDIKFDWTQIPDWEDPIDSVTVFFYGEDGRVFHKTGSCNGFSWILPVQKYKVIGYNKYASGVTYSYLENYEKAKVMADLLVKAPASIMQHRRVIFDSNINLTLLANGSTVLLMNPKLLSKKIEYRVIFSGNYNIVKGCTATFNGVIEGVYLHNGEYINSSPEFGKLTAELDKTNEYTVEIFVFGLNSNVKDNVSLLFKYENGSNQILDIDISEAFKEFTSTKKITLYVDITLATEGDLNAKLKSWVATEEEIKLE